MGLFDYLSDNNRYNTGRRNTNVALQNIPSNVRTLQPNRQFGGSAQPIRQFGNPLQSGQTGLPGFSRGTISGLVSEFPQDQQPFVSAGLNSIGATVDYNKDVINEILAGIFGSPKSGTEGGRRGTPATGGLIGDVRSSFDSVISDLDNPYSNELRSSILASIQDQIAKETKTNIEISRQNFASRGLSGSSDDLEAQYAEKNAATQGRVQATLKTLSDQISANTTAAGVRGDVVGKKEDIIAKLGTFGAGLKTGNILPLDLGFNAAGDLLSTLLGQENADKIIKLSEDTAQANQPTLIEGILKSLSLLFPGNQRLLGASGIPTALGF